MTTAQVSEVEHNYVHFCASLVLPKLRPERIRQARIEFRELCKDVNITHVLATPQGVYVGTRLLVADDSLHEIGEFLLSITHTTVSWENITRQVNGFHAPYISFGKTCCSRESQRSELSMYIKDGRLDRAFPLMIVIARATPGYTTTTEISKWPIAKTQLLAERAMEATATEHPALKTNATQWKGWFTWLVK